MSRKIGFTIGDRVIIYQFDSGIYSLFEGKLQPLPHCQGFGKTSSGYTTILPYDDQRLFIVSEKMGCWLYDLKGGSLKRFKTEIDEYIKHNIFFIPGSSLMRIVLSWGPAKGALSL